MFDIGVAFAGPPQQWGEDWDGDGKDDHFFTDEDGDGNPDSMGIDDDEDGTWNEYWADTDDDGDWDVKLENDGDNRRPPPNDWQDDWDRIKTDTDGDHDLDEVTEDSDNDGSYLNETPMPLNPEEAIPANRPREGADDRKQGCVGPGCPSPSQRGACRLTGGGCVSNTDPVMCSALGGTYEGNGTLCVTFGLPAVAPSGIAALLFALALTGGITLAWRKRQARSSGA
ncbi:MAG TPA: hypothetical protein VGK93_10490 [Candidatus Eisenbacteria bacterium]|jgi:hypothetical protein